MRVNLKINSYLMMKVICSSGVHLAKLKAQPVSHVNER